ncbi:PREDICTED: homeobox-leucine zipper protein HAT3-like [Tarenaya hassleriana]|uniref:homeobox-leucine zipper protein HAT3-like n=1 Tax=Tarenaya hassleriana TaxID=28532 RepID=UPI00053C715C|nr:PREDICTED: homeobox-leucine zipper protein HAT3-like [Tarenaya hassleriana]
MAGRDDGLSLGLGLSLSSGFPQQKEPSLSLKLMPMASSSPHMQSHHSHSQKIHNSWTHLFQSSDRVLEARSSFPRGIDVNRAPSASATAGVGDVEEDGGASSPNSTVSSSSGKRSDKPGAADDIDAERASCSRGSDDEDGGNGDGSRKKLRLSKEQSLVLEETFKEYSTLNPKQKLALAKQLNLRPRQVEVWFQNRRARTKLKQTEVDCEYLKRCCENLTSENRRLQKEVSELRALKLSPHLYMHMNPPTTLTMCPSCERVSSSSPSSARDVGPSPQRPNPANPWASLRLHQRPAAGSH